MVIPRKYGVVSQAKTMAGSTCGEMRVGPVAAADDCSRATRQQTHYSRACRTKNLFDR